MFPDDSNPKYNAASTPGSSPTPQPINEVFNLENENFSRRKKETIPLIPEDIAVLRGVVEKFDPIEKELLKLPVEEVLSEKLKAHFDTDSLASIKRLLPDELELILEGETKKTWASISQLVVLPRVRAGDIPEFRVDPKGIFSLIERFTALHSAVVFFSSPYITPVHHDRLLNYALSWVDRVDLRRDLLADRINLKITKSTVADWNSFRKVSYQRIPFKDLLNQEWAAHIILSNPDYGGTAEVDSSAQSLKDYGAAILELGLNSRRPLNILNNPKEIISLLSGEQKHQVEKFDVIDLRKLGGVNKQKIFNNPADIKLLISVLSERGVMFTSFNHWDYKAKTNAFKSFNTAVLELNLKSSEILNQARKRHLESWDSPPQVWLPWLEHKVEELQPQGTLHTLILKEIKESTLPEHLAMLTREQKANLIREYQLSDEFKELISSRKGSTSKKVINFILGELISIFDGGINCLTPISKVAERFSSNSKSITQYQSDLNPDVRILLHEERAKSARHIKDSVVRQVEEELEAHVGGQIKYLSNNHSLREKYGIAAGFLKSYLETGLSPWQQRYRKEELAKMPSRQKIDKGEFVLKVSSHLRMELKRYFESGMPISKTQALMKRFECSKDLLNDAIRRGLTKDEQEERLKIIFTDHYANVTTKLKPEVRIRLEDALLSVREDIESFKEAKSSSIRPLMTRAKLFGLTTDLLGRAIEQTLSEDDLKVYKKGSALGRQEIKAQMMKRNRAPSVKRSNS